MRALSHSLSFTIVDAAWVATSAVEHASTLREAAVAAQRTLADADDRVERLLLAPRRGAEAPSEAPGACAARAVCEGQAARGLPLEKWAHTGISKAKMKLSKKEL